MERIEKLQYDKKADVLYIYFKDPEEIDRMVSEEIREGILLDREESTDEIVGYTIMDLGDRQEAIGGLEISSQEIVTA